VGHRAALIDVCFLATAFDFNSAMRASFIGALTIVDCEKHLNVLPHYQLAAHAFYGPDESILRYDESDTVFVGVTVSQHRAVPRTVFTRWNLSDASDRVRHRQRKDWRFLARRRSPCQSRARQGLYPSEPSRLRAIKIQ
jgi:hypothetical protein